MFSLMYCTLPGNKIRRPIHMLDLLADGLTLYGSDLTVFFLPPREIEIITQLRLAKIKVKLNFDFFSSHIFSDVSHTHR